MSPDLDWSETIGSFANAWKSSSLSPVRPPALSPPGRMSAGQRTAHVDGNIRGQGEIRRRGRLTLEKVRFGILGCGVIGPHHARAIAGLESAELVAVADVVPELAEKLAGEYGCSPYPGLEEMLSSVDLDAVCICTPSGMHAEDAITTLEAGKDVVIE